MKGTESASSNKGIPAAQYVRMSTEDQVYSIANQQAAIQEYAAQHGFNIVNTYEDAGKSGVILKRRSGLRQLLQDVLNRDVSFRVILVYDVSRWGRFQDVDESAYYEFICKQSGIQVHYCAEQFPNDNTPSAAMLKALKRSMAAEFSRELGEKVFRGKHRIAALGYTVGGKPTFGYRRMMVSADGKRKMILQQGERKSLTTDRVILIPGPEKEIATMRYMFRLAARSGMGCTEIARTLNQKGMLHREAHWTHKMVLYLLRNPVYTGCSIWNRTTGRLLTPVRQVPPEDWVVKSGAFVPLIDKATFDQAQANLLRHKARTWTDEQLLKKLKHLLAAKERLSFRLIRDMRGMARMKTLQTHLGSWAEICEKAGYQAPLWDRFGGSHAEQSLKLRRDLVGRIISMFPEHVSVTQLPKTHTRSILRIDDDFYVAVNHAVFTRRFPRRRTNGYWFVRSRPAEEDYITLFCRLNERRDGIRDCYVFPRLNLGTSSHRSYKRDPWLTKGKRLYGLSDFYETVRQLHERDVQSPF